MNPLSNEVFTSFLKAGLTLSALWYALNAGAAFAAASTSTAEPSPAPLKPGLGRWFTSSALLGALLVFPAYFKDSLRPPESVMGAISGSLFFICFLLGLGAMGAVLHNGWASVLTRRTAPWRVAAVVSALSVSLSMSLSGVLTIETALQMDIPLVNVLGYAAFGVILPVAIFVTFLRRPSMRVGEYFGPGQIVFLSALILMLSGFGAGNSLIASVQRGFMKFIHDVVHQVFVYLMVPDHPMLTLTTWDFVGIFFGPNFALTLSLPVLLLPPLAYLYYVMTLPLTVPAELSGAAHSAAERRVWMARRRRQVLRQSTLAAVFILMISMFWFSGGTESASSLYLPDPRPVIVDKGIVQIPLNDPTMNLMDGNLHKFSLLLEGQEIVIDVIRRPDGKLAVVLDACEICPPKGYGLSGENVVCVFCMTPIAVDTLGKPGGCNPIPLVATITDMDIRIDVQAISDKWRLVTTGASKEGIR